MKIGPVDIRNHTFPFKMRGLDEGQVRAFLDLVADCLVRQPDARHQRKRLDSPKCLLR